MYLFCFASVFCFDLIYLCLSHTLSPASSPTPRYIHRVGRTARAGRKGNAISFLLPSEAGFIDVLHKCGANVHNIAYRSIIFSLSLNLPKNRVKTLSEFKERLRAHTRKAKKKRMMERENEEDEERRRESDGFYRAISIQRYSEGLVNDGEREGRERAEEEGEEGRSEFVDLYPLACRAYTSFIRSYATHSSALRSIFHPKMLHYGHIAKAFALKDTPSNIVRFTPFLSLSHTYTSLFFNYLSLHFFSPYPPFSLSIYSSAFTPTLTVCISGCESKRPTSQR